MTTTRVMDHTLLDTPEPVLKSWGKLDAKLGDPEGADLRDLQRHAVDPDDVAGLRTPPEVIEHEAGERARTPLGQGRAGGLLEVVDRHRARGLDRLVVAPRQLVVGQVELALELAHELLEDVVQGDDAGRP